MRCCLHRWYTMRTSRLVAVLFCLWAIAARGADSEHSPFGELSWRSLGPPNMSGRVADIEGIPGDPRRVYVGSASGGVWKTSDGGTTFKPIFDEPRVASIGDIALAPSNPGTVYVGTGEDAVRNSVSFGRGMYKTTDAGKSWQRAGLSGTQYISRIQVHPHDPDIVYAGVLGPIYAESERRGVFRSTDGGQSWEKVHYIDAVHGVSDLVMHPSNPQILYAGMWKFQRKPWDFTSGSRDGGVYRSTDGGDTWEKLDNGLPELMGRIGIAVAPSEPETVYVVAETNEGTVFRSTDGGERFEMRSDDVRTVSRGFYYSKIRVDPLDANRVYSVASLLMRSVDGGKHFERISESTHIDFHALWIDPDNPDRIWQGQDGGVAVSYDRGGSWTPMRNLPIGQFYQVFYDDREPFYRVGGGLQDNGTWIGPSRTRERKGIYPHDWKMFSFGDAYWAVDHPDKPEVYISESQAGGIVRTDLASGQQVDISPQPMRNDGGPVADLKYRFNWNAPIVASPHAGETVYFGANVVFKTEDFGDTWSVISPDLTNDDPDKQGPAGGPVWPENTTAEYHNTIISLAESPAVRGVLWAGTDDGNLHVSEDGGEHWRSVFASTDMPALSPVSHVEPSQYDGASAYVSFDRHMFDDRSPYILKTTDRGESWQRIDSGLPDQAYVWVVREDRRNPEVLYAGTELGLFVSHNGGDGWRELDMSNLPSVAVHDIRIHPRENDLILGTHGRGIYIFDDATPVQEYDQSIADEPLHLFPVRRTLRYAQTFQRYGLGDRMFIAPNPAYGAPISYHLSADMAERLNGGGASEEDRQRGQAAAGDSEDSTRPRFKLEILDAEGAVIRTIARDELGTEAGVNRVTWDLAGDPPRLRTEEFQPSSPFDRPPRGVEVLPGTYTVRLTAGDRIETAEVDVGVDPSLDVAERALAVQRRAAQRLLPMESVLNDALRGIDTVTAQLDERQRTLSRLGRDSGGDLSQVWAEHRERLKGLEERLTRPEGVPRWSQGPGLLERVQRLRGKIDSGFRRPSAEQMALIGTLRERFDEALAEVNGYLADELTALNQRLEAAGMPAVAVPDSVSLKE